MDILQIHNFYQAFGGEDKVVNAEKELLEARGHKVIQYTRHNDEIKGYSFLQKIKFFAETIYSMRTFKELGKLIDGWKPDVAHMHNAFPLISPSVYYFLKQHKIPVVQMVHNYRFLCPNGSFYSHNAICEKCKEGKTSYCFLRKCYKGSFLLSALYAFTFWIHRRLKAFTGRIDMCIAPSHFVKKKLIEGGFPEGKIEVEGNCVGEDELIPQYKKQNYAIFIGRLSAEKGLVTMLKALQKVHGTKLKIAGRGSTEGELKEYVDRNRLTQVEFMGFVSGNKKLKLLQKARFGIVPSECYETFSMSVLESFSVGTPVVASRIGGLPELVEDGRNGLLFEPGNSNDLAEKINYLHENPDKALEMGRYARKTVEEKYGPEKHYSKLMAIYEKAIAENKKKGS